MEPITQKLIHSFGALADLGQEVASSGDFNEMVRTSLHLLLGTLAIRRGLVIESAGSDEKTNTLAVWGVDEGYQPPLLITDADRKAFLESEQPVLSINSDRFQNESLFPARHSAELRAQQFELIVPMIVHDSLAGLVLLGGKASG